MRCWILRLLVILSTANRMGTMRLQCSKEFCYLYDVSSQEDTFAYQYIPKDVDILTVENVMMEHVDHSILDGVPSFIDNLIIQNSYTLRWISVPQAVGNLLIVTSNLRRIDIEANSSMTYLGVSLCDLVKVPDALQNARQLEWLHITSCKLQGLNLASLCDNAHLGTLNLMGNKIRYVVNTSTRYCGMYDTLASITLSENLLTTVNMELFGVLVKMDTLYLHNNRIRALAGELIHSTVIELRMDGNKLMDLDLCGWCVPSLTRILLDRNNLTFIPECLNMLTNVSLFTMRSNQLSNFSIESVAGMNNLRHLDLSCNKLTMVSLQTVNFPANLELLNVDYNNLTALDLFFIPVKVALQVRVSFNLISNFDVSVASRNVTQLTMYDNLIVCEWNTPLVRERNRCNKTEGNVLLVHNARLRSVCRN
uniref:Leucine rich immune protein (Coil-less) n=1 Tax=Anopheles christyi TaxID=43041 RepID=A0A182KHJ7_9DIPT